MGEGSGLNSVMAVTEEPYITDLDLDSFLIDVTDNALDLVTTEVGGVTAATTGAGVMATTEAGVMATEVGNTVEQIATDWLHNATLAGGGGDKGPSTILSDILLGNQTEDSRIGFTFPATELPETVISGQVTTAPRLTDYTAEIFDLLTGRRGNDGDRLANGFELTKDEDFGHTDNVNGLFDDRKLSVTGLAADFTQNAQHVFLTAEPPSGGLRDYTDNVFKMLFHADELDGLLELDGDTNCTVWNATERAADRVGGAYGLDQNFLMGELVLVMVLCIPASLAVIIYILRQAAF
jgi:hypothetical protein